MINDLISRIVVLLCFMMRSTSIILWIAIWPYELFTLKTGRIKFILKNMVQMYIIVLYRVLMLGSSILFNSYWYGKFVCV